MHSLQKHNLITVCSIIELLETINRIPKGDTIMAIQNQFIFADIINYCQMLYLILQTNISNSA